MKRGPVLILATALALAAGAAGYYVHRVLLAPAEVAVGPLQATPAAIRLGDPRPPFALADLDGRLRSADEWDGKVLVVNFWATWCPPCRKEIPEFMALQEAHGDQGLQFLGIAIDEPDKVRAYAEDMGINYPLLVGEMDAIAVSKAYGNQIGALPYTAVVDRQGRLVYTHRGEMTREEMEQALQGLL